jgi:hypothetical protein
MDRIECDWMGASFYPVLGPFGPPQPTSTPIIVTSSFTIMRTRCANITFYK